MIHFIFVPTLVFGFQLIFTKIPLNLPFFTEFLKPYPLLATNFGFLLMILLVGYYLALNLQIGVRSIKKKKKFFKLQRSS